MAMQVDTATTHTRALEQAGRIIAGVTADQFGDATPCRQWKTRELINHLVGGNFMFAKVGAGEPMDVSGPPPDLLGDDPSAAFAASRAAVAAAFAAPGALDKIWVLPFAEMPGAAARNVHVIEVVAHTWDIAKASGQLDTLDPDLAEVAEGIARAVVQPGIRNASGDPFGPEVTVGSAAGAYDRFAGFLGRTP